MRLAWRGDFNDDVNLNLNDNCGWREKCKRVNQYF